MPTRSYLLWAAGEDRPGFVAEITQKLFQLGCNLEDSSMMRLGSEFGIFLIFSSKKALRADDFSTLKKKRGLSLGLKTIPSKMAKFSPIRRPLFMVRVYGPDHPGIVYRVTECLSRHGFNITDLSTHQTHNGKKAGYILLIEGELPRSNSAVPLRRQLAALEKSLRTRISFEPLVSSPL